MSVALKNTEGIAGISATKIIWAVFILYLIVSGYTIAHHELWADEVHSWNISKGSGSYFDLISNRRYEGHPAGWYTILWTISKFTHNVAYMQVAQWTIASMVVCMILFFSPFPLSTKILLPFGYYFLFEYAALSRNYAIAVLLAFCICHIIRKDFKYKIILYYILLFCMSNIHLLATLLAAALHVYFLLLYIEQKKPKRTIILNIIPGGVVFLPALYSIFPPSDGALNIHFWLNGWDYHRITALIEIPLRAFMPIQAWWKYNFWNTEFLIDAKSNFHIFKVLNLLISFAALLSIFFILRRNKKSLALFGSNLLFSLIIASTAFSLMSARYSGFVFISLIVSYWLYCYEVIPTKNNKWLINSFLVIQIIAGLFSVSMDIRFPFSNLYKVNELVKEVPGKEKIVTDYWTMNAYVAYTDKPGYCIDLQKEVSFVMWDSDLAALPDNPARYSSGIKKLF